jgi:hypothetical protein
MRVLYARTRYDYGSYTDWWELVRLAGLETCYVDEIDPLAADTIYIATPLTGELKSRELFERRTTIVWLNLERPDGEHAPDLNAVVADALRYVDDIWVSDRYYATLHPRFRFVPLGSHPGLALDQVGPLTQSYDYAHHSYVERRRNHIYGSLHGRGLRGAPNSWGLERAEHVRSSKFVLNVHQTKAPIGEPLRFAWAAAYARPMLSEFCADPFPLVPDVDFVQRYYKALTSTAQEMAQEVNEELGRNLFQRLCVEWQFPRGPNEALHALMAERGLL